MSSKVSGAFTKSNLDTYFRELAKEYRKLGGKNLPAEIILIGGAAVLINYGFREMTTDIDAVIQAASTMKEAINNVGDRFDLPNGWLNEDFKRTASYSPKLIQYSSYYKRFYGVLTVRTVAAEYLIAMKLMAGRQYKNDLSDIIGVLDEHSKSDNPITIEMIRKAAFDLYGKWEALPKTAREFAEAVLKNGDYEKARAEVMAEESETRTVLIEFEDNYPGAANKDNVENILAQLKKKK